MNTGTNDARAAIAWRPNCESAPNIVLSTGAVATIGITARAATIGAESSSMNLLIEAKRAKAIPRIEPTSKPSSELVPVMRLAVHRDGATSTIAEPILPGLGSK
jgi:hypothetical protein